MQINISIKSIVHVKIKWKIYIKIHNPEKNPNTTLVEFPLIQTSTKSVQKNLSDRG